MNCPYCGSEIREGEKFCQNCGAPLTQAPVNAAVPAEEPTLVPAGLDEAPGQSANGSANESAYAGAAPAPGSFKDFIHSDSCPPQIRKSIRSGWITLLICAVITLIAQLMLGSIPLDAIVLVALAFWLRGSCSKTPAIIALVYGLFGMILSLTQKGAPGGYLVVLAGGLALSNILKAEKIYKEYLAGGGR